MIKQLAVCCTAALMVATSTAAEAAKPKPTVIPAKAGIQKKAVKTKAAAKAPAKPSSETLTCRDGTENRHARIGVVLASGKVESFAYYSKWKPRTCSIHLSRTGDRHSTWIDRGNVTQISVPRGGEFTIERLQGAYRFVFKNVDRERYCGMDGMINGTLIVRKGSQQCQVAGIMEEGTPLGQAWAHLEQPPVTTAAAPPVTTTDALPVTTASGAALTTTQPAVVVTPPSRRESYSFKTYND